MSNMHRLYTEFGQSMWMDYLDRDLWRGDGLRTLVGSGLRGITSNPTIFHKAIANSAAYDDAIRDLLQADHEMDAAGLYQWLSVQDVQNAADTLEHVYAGSAGGDGYVSLEVSPHLAYDADATVEAARHLWRTVQRPNLMIKVPGTVPGLTAFERLIGEGINVNVTLLFSVTRYQAVTEAYLRGLAHCAAPQKVASVASFFVSRVDSKVDAALDEIGSAEALALKGRIAIANAKLAYQHFQQTLKSPEYAGQLERGARPQRPLWASTSTKNPAYSDVLYVEQLIGAGTVNTVPPETLDAFQAHGELRATLGQDLAAAERDLEALAELGVNLPQITELLEQEGVKKFGDSHDQLLTALDEKRVAATARYASG